jgi:2-phosphoglycerate kinase
MPVAYKPPKKHKCTIFGPFVKGNIENIGTEPLFRLEVSKVEDFLGRRLEMQEVIQNIATNRLVTIKGIPGIGKTTLAKTVAYFLDER